MWSNLEPAPVNGSSGLPIPAGSADIAQLLDDHHLVVLGSDPESRADFALTLTEQLEALPDSEIARLEGGEIEDLASFCRQLEGQLPGQTRIKRTMEAVIRLLRFPPHEPKHQYFLWEDADTLLERDAGLFGRLTNALIGAAADREHVQPDVLVLQRTVFLGGPRLEAYAGEERGQLQSWLEEDDTFWEVLTCLPRPPVLTYRLDG